MLSSTTSKNTYTGNGAVDTYAYGFKIFDDDDLLVTVRDTSGVETTLTKTTHYTVTGVGETSGGNVALVNGAFDWIDGDGDLKTSYVLTIRRVLTLSQDLDLRNQGSYLPEDVEDRFDKNIMIAQQQQDEVDRSVKLPETIAPSSFDPTFPADLLANGAGGVPTVNDAGTGWADAAEWPTATEVSAAQGYAQAADASADAALVSEGLAEEWAIKVDGIVDSTDYSSKAWAIGGTGVTETASRGAAKEWATKTDAAVDTSEYSAKEWARGTQTRGASGGGSAKDWANYTAGTVDDTGYSAKYWAEDAQATAAGFSSDLSTHEADTTGIHGITDTANLVTKDGSETLTNKTLTSPVISTISNTGTVTLPTATTTLVGRDTTDTLTNKTLTSPAVNSGTLNTPVIDVASLTEQGSTPSTPSSGTKKFYAKTDGKVYTLNSAGEERQVGAGAGAGGKNYLTDLFDGTSVSGINTYADAAATSPVDGTGGSPSISAAALNTSTELRGTSNQRFSKGAANEQGEGWSIDFEVDRQDYEGGKPLFVSFGYETSANYATGDVRMFVYDQTNATLLNVTAINGDGSLTASPDPSRFTGVFYPVSSSSSYRLIWHITSTNASAWDLDVIDLSVSPQSVVPGAIQTLPESWTPTGSWVSNTTYTGRKWRIGGYGYYEVTVATTGAPTATQLLVNMPSGEVIDTAQLTNSTAAVAPLLGFGTINDGGSRIATAHVVFSTTSQVAPLYADASVASGGITATAPMTWANGDNVTFFFCAPIVGWAASAALSTTEAMFSTAKARYSGGTQTISVASATILNASTKTYDTLNSVTTGANWKFTAPRSGYYSVDAFVQYVSRTYADGNLIVTQLFKNGVYYSQDGGTEISGTPAIVVTSSLSDTVYLAKGDYLDVRAYNAGSVSTNTDVFQIAVTEQPDFSIFSTYGTFELLTATSSVKTPTATGNYSQMTSNSLTLTPGTWRLTGNGSFANSGSPTYSYGILGWYGANGADSSSVPAALSTVSGLTVLSVQGAIQSGIAQAINDFYLNSAPVIVRCTTSCTVYLVPYATMTTAANARITVYANAERLQ